MITPWGSAYYLGGLLALTVGPDGTATGGIVGPASFMWLRAQRIPRYHVGHIIRPEDTPVVSSTALHPWPVAGDVNAATAIGLRRPGCESFYRGAPHPEPPYEIRQSGHRKLWDQVEAAYRWWIDAGKPAVDAWKFTVTPSGQRIELP